MPAIKVNDHITYVGVLDKDLRVFDIIMYTDYGTTYNSYVVKGNEKTVLFETVKDGFFDQFYENLKEACDISKIDYIVVSHTEPDHTGSLKRVLELAPNATVLGSNTAIEFLKNIVNGPFPCQVVTENDTFDLGGLTLTFLNTPMLHWPDTMFTYIPEIKALFTCDCFGCHYADDRVFNDAIQGDFIDAYHYYFTHIMGPFKTPFLMNAIKKVEGLDIEFIGNGHGPVIRKDPKKYIQMYKEWCVHRECRGPEKEVVVAYMSAYGYTKQLADAIKEGLSQGGIQQITMYDLVYDDKQKAAEDLAAADGFLIGSPTMVGDALPPAYEMLLGLNPIIHRGRFAGAFGSYGWSGEAALNLLARMKQLKLNLPLEAFRVKFKPTQEDLEAARQFGIDFAKAVLG